MASPASRPYFKLPYFTLCFFYIFSLPYLLWARRLWQDCGRCTLRCEQAPGDTAFTPPIFQNSQHARVHCIAFSTMSIFCFFSKFLQPWKYLPAFWAVRHLLLLPRLEFQGPRTSVSFPCLHISISWGFPFNVFLSQSCYWFSQCLCLESAEYIPPRVHFVQFCLGGTRTPYAPSVASHTQLLAFALCAVGLCLQCSISHCCCPSLSTRPSWACKILLTYSLSFSKATAILLIVTTNTHWILMKCQTLCSEIQ